MKTVGMAPIQNLPDVTPVGLTSREAADKLQQFGSNAVAETQPHEVVALLRKLWGVIPWMLELALIIDLILGKWIEALVIGALLVVNAIIEFLQEGRAQQALALVRERLTVNARVRRDGHWQTVPAIGIVPDDLVHLRVGDIVPADIRLTDGQIQVDQSQLTGESLPVEYQSGNTVYAGSLVSRGEATGLVTATGARTYFGKTAELVRTAEAPRRLEGLIVKIAKYLGAVVMVLAVAAFAAMIIRGTPLSEMLPFGLMLLIASVPVALPMMFTMSAALGARALAEGGILVTRLSAIQDAASMDILCLDKTGTITENRLTVGSLEPSNQTTVDELLRLSGVDIGARRIRKGAVDSILKDAGGIAPAEFTAAVERIARTGGTPLAVSENSRLLGVIHLKDVVKPGIKERFSSLRAMGIRTVMVTGDNRVTAAAIAAEAGVDDFIAEATPQDKLDYIRKAQEGGRLVAMCGDGTNDAPALAQADVGVALQTGTQAARDAANMVDLDSNPTKLIEVVEIGKQMLITRGALTTFSIANDVAKYFAILPALFVTSYPQLGTLNVMGLSTPASAILSAVIFNALVIVVLIPLALKGVRYRAEGAAAILGRNLAIYGLGGLVAPFVGIKLIDLIVSSLGWA